MLVDFRSLEPYGDAYIPQFYPPVIVEDTHLDVPFCKQVIAGLHSPSSSGVFDNSEGTAKHVVDTYHRSSKALQLAPELYTQVADRMTAAVNAHSTKLLDKTAFLAESLQFLSYDEVDKGHFLMHTDNAYYDAKGVFQYTSPQRMLTCIVFLNQDYEGGELILGTVRQADGRQLRFKPMTGQLVLFPSDIRFPHEVTAVTRGKRYSIVGWFGLK